jgi:hypothetical protein
VYLVQVSLLLIGQQGLGQAGLALKNPPKKTQKTHLKKPTKNVFFGVFWGFLNF